MISPFRYSPREATWSFVTPSSSCFLSVSRCDAMFAVTPSSRSISRKRSRICWKVPEKSAPTAALDWQR